MTQQDPGSQPPPGWQSPPPPPPPADPGSTQVWQAQEPPSTPPAPPPPPPQADPGSTQVWQAQGPPSLPAPTSPSFPPQTYAPQPAPGMVTGSGVLSGGPAGDYPINLLIEVPTHNSRLFAIPLLGYLLRLIFLLPHLIVLMLLSYIVLGIVLVINVFVVLFTGRAAGFYYTIAGGILRWATRVGAYFFGLTDKYPPFRLGN